MAIKAVAICHSDVTFHRGGWGGDLPAVYGHEASGVVLATGAGVAGYAPGDRVIVTMVRACGDCVCCSRESYGLCEGDFTRATPVLTDDTGAAVTQGLKTGAFAEEALVHVSQLAPLPDDVPFDVAALIACGVITGYGAVKNTARMRSGASVAVIGVGGVGLNVLQAARINGAGQVIAIDPATEKLAAARAFGADLTLNPAQTDVAEEVLAATGGRGVDYCFVAAGVRTAIEQGFGLLATLGKVVIVGIPPSGVEATIDPVTFASSGQTAVGSKMDARIAEDIPELIAHYRAGRLKLDELITARYPFEQINDAMEAAAAGRGLRNVVMIGK